MKKKPTYEELVATNRELSKEALRCRPMEKALLSKEGQYRKIFNSAMDGLLIFDRKGRIVEANPQACRMYGYTHDEMITLTREDIMHPDYHHLFDFFRRETREKGMFAAESKDVRKDGTHFYIEIRGTEFDYNDRKHVLAIVRDVTGRKQMEASLREALSAIEQLKERVESENIYLREEIELRYQHKEIIGQSEAIQRTLSQVERVAETAATVLLIGETGTGKELLARAIHRLSPRRGNSMVKVNCAAIPASLMESELFGHEKGAFTDAFARQIGRFEIAHGSTLFLDEISELPLALQAKLLRVLQDCEFERLGNPRTIRVDVRIIAATNKDLSLAVAEGRFREDLFYRLNVFPILVPPLRDRREDIPLFVWGFVREFEKNMGKHITAISKKTMEVLQSYGWPGNVRELRNVIERAMILSQHGTLLVELPDKNPGKGSPVSTSLADIERQHISDVLAKTGGRIRGKHGAAEILGLKPSTLDSKMKKLGIRRRLDLHEIP
ncbi:MAG: sigma 54-interacting transcriptional regulator [Syntrophales bacterium]|jgi:PAS domain S-box-containing protein|nr:sigma 54-interacting transcriptional regulator [Syntrophales bacterium]